MIGLGGRLCPVPVDSAVSGPKLFIPDCVVAELDRLVVGGGVRSLVAARGEGFGRLARP